VLTGVPQPYNVRTKQTWTLFLLSWTFQTTRANQNFEEKSSPTFGFLTFFIGLLNPSFSIQIGLEVGGRGFQGEIGSSEPIGTIDLAFGPFLQKLERSQQ